MKFNYVGFNSILDCMVDTSYLPLRPFDWPPASSPVFEIENFSCETGSEATPHNSYRNHLYVYPVSLKFDSQRHFNKVKLIESSLIIGTNYLSAFGVLG